MSAQALSPRRWRCWAAGSAGLLVLSLAAAADAPKSPGAASCIFRDDQVAVFAERDFKGACAVRGPGTYPTSESIGLAKQPIMSIKAGARVEVKTCGIASNGTSDCRNVRHEERWVMGIAPVTYLRVATWPDRGEECKPDPEQLAILSRTDMCRKVGPGKYANGRALKLEDPDLAFFTSDENTERRRREGAFMSTNDVRSVLTGKGVQARVCEQNEFGGQCSNMRPGSTLLLKSVRSIQLYRACMASDSEAAVHLEDGAWGRCAKLPAAVYSTAQALRLDGAAARTVQIGPSMAGTACSAEGLQGECWEIAPNASPDGRDIRSLQLRRVEVIEPPRQ